jgi:hypothetical protein
MKTLLTFLCILFSIAATAQHEADNWYFGYNAGITFATNPPTFLSGGQINILAGCSSISDANGNLLFYSDGVTVWDRNHNIMPNGTGLSGFQSSTESALIIPAPGSTSLYYLFTASGSSTTDSLCYSIVNMVLNGGMGDVTVKNVGLLGNSTEKLTATLHSNGTDIWVVAHKFNSADFYSFILSATGINPIPIVSSIGTPHSGDYRNAVGYMKTSPCGDKIATAVYFDNFLELFDFDNSTGIVSNPIQLGNWWGISNYGVYGVEFSPDGSRIYASIIQPANVIQWNLLAGSSAAIIASATTIGTSLGATIGALQAGPDGRIYMTKYQSQTLACILNPNALGFGCAYFDSFILLYPDTSAYGLPNFLTSYFCNLNVSTTNANVANNQITISPNPATTTLHITLSQNTTGCIYVDITNTLGKTVYSSVITNTTTGNEVPLPLTGFQKGIYFLRLQSKDGVVVRKFAVE